jgi:predicted nucleotidyltransferase
MSAHKMDISQLVKEKREEILRIAAKHGAYNVRIFGSVARGDAGPESDVDFLVDVGQEHSSWFPAGLIADLEDLLGRKVDVAEPEGLHWYIRERVLKEAVPL